MQASTRPTKKKPLSQPAPTALLPSVTEVGLKGYKYGAEPKKAAVGKLDITFVLDCTASMSSTIAACQKDICGLVNQLKSQEG